VTNAERLVHLRRGREELQQVRDELLVASATCTHCGRVFDLDAEACRLDDEIQVMVERLTGWIERLAARRPTSERVSQETPSPR